ncbi:MAG: Pyridoxine 4-dehydrogenase [Thelocarpon superellum]|nr:MAG: Pyridoxine 4-dehydrogenase [Thelocarpon superellum]
MTTITGKKIGVTGFGLMGLTWRPTPTPTEEAIKVMKAALEAGANFWNAGELYGTPEYNSLHLLHAYFTKYPADAEKVVLSIKGGLKPGALAPDGSEQNVRRSVDECLRVLDGTKFIDIFECARVDPKVPLETNIEVLASYVKEGTIGGIGLSEVEADHIRRASKVHKIAAVEVELSLFSTDILENGVAATCAELAIPVVGYSPLSRGLLTGQVTSTADIPEGDFRRHLPRFQNETLEKNLILVREVQSVAQKKGCTPGQIAIAWVRGLNGLPGMPEVVPIPGATTVGRVSENMTVVTLSAQEMEHLQQLVSKHVVAGGRY